MPSRAALIGLGRTLGELQAGAGTVTEELKERRKARRLGELGRGLAEQPGIGTTEQKIFGSLDVTGMEGLRLGTQLVSQRRAQEAKATEKDIERRAKDEKRQQDLEQRAFDNEMKIAALELRGEANAALRREARARIIDSTSNRFQNNPRVRAMNESQQFMNASMNAAVAGNIASDLVMVKALEKLIQPTSAVLEGEAKAISTAGTILGRIDELGLWDSVKGQLKGRLPDTLRQQIFDLSKGLYKGRLNSYNNFKGSREKLVTETFGLDITKEDADRMFPSVPVIDVDSIKFDKQGRVIGVDPKKGELEKIAETGTKRAKKVAADFKNEKDDLISQLKEAARKGNEKAIAALNERGISF